MLNLYALFCGALLAFAFAPMNVWPLAIFSSGALLFLWDGISPKRAAWHGFMFGLGVFGVGVSWVYISIHRYGHVEMIPAALITFLFVALLASFFALQGYTFTKLFPKAGQCQRLLAFPCLWVAMEWARTWLFTGFPWLLLGNSQLTSPISHVAPVFGVWGVSAITALTGALAYNLLTTHKTTKIFSMLSLLVVASLCVALGKIHWTRPLPKPITVSLIQGNIPQERKWQPHALQSIIDDYQRLSESQWHSQLVVWPEAAIPLATPWADPLLKKFDAIAKQQSTTLITGIPLQNPKGEFFNGIVALGKHQGQYLKRHLVPFGEFVPFKALFQWFVDWMQIPLSDMAAGPDHQALLTVGHHKIAPFICYEVAYPSLVRTDAAQASMLLSVIDDSWFGESFAPAQHLAIAQMRALETGRYLLASSNSGITAIASPSGELTAKIPPFQPQVLQARVPSVTGATPWLTWGRPLIYIVILSGLLLAYWRCRL